MLRTPKRASLGRAAPSCRTDSRFLEESRREDRVGNQLDLWSTALLCLFGGGAQLLKLLTRNVLHNVTQAANGPDQRVQIFAPDHVVGGIAGLHISALQELESAPFELCGTRPRCDQPRLTIFGERAQKT